MWLKHMKTYTTVCRNLKKRTVRVNDDMSRVVVLKMGIRKANIVESCEMGGRLKLREDDGIHDELSERDGSYGEAGAARTMMPSGSE